MTKIMRLYLQAGFTYYLKPTVHRCVSFQDQASSLIEPISLISVALKKILGLR